MAQSPPEIARNKGEKKEKSCWQCGRTFFTELDLCPDDGARLIVVDVNDESDPLIGTVFDGRFKIISKLGEGGMGSVYKAHRLDFETDVAVKLLKADFARDEGIRKRFMYEARVISNLKHPHSVRLYDFGQTEAGHVYMVMELLEGESLADRLGYRFVTYREAFDIVIPVCGVLGEAHLRDVIHRDLKPENIYLLQVDGNKEFPKLIDFGIAKHNRAETMTKSGTLWGTPAYMSPEQARGDKVGAPADIYGMGIMLYELICGNLPFHASTQMGFAVKHINEEARALRSIPGLTSVPEELDGFILSMIAKDPSDRPATMELVSETLEAIRDRYFDDALLDSVPAEEVDPIALQRWINEAPDISQTIPAERFQGDDVTSDTLVSGENFAVVNTPTEVNPPDLGLMTTLPGEVPEYLVHKQGNPALEDSGEASKKVGRAKVIIPIVMIVLVSSWLLFFILTPRDDADPSGEVPEPAPLAVDPLEPVQGGEAAVSAATLQAAHVVFNARNLIQRLDDGEAEEEDFDFLNQPPQVGDPVPPRSPDDGLREKLEGTF